MASDFFMTESLHLGKCRLSLLLDLTKVRSSRLLKLFKL